MWRTEECHFPRNIISERRTKPICIGSILEIDDDPNGRFDRYGSKTYKSVRNDNYRRVRERIRRMSLNFIEKKSVFDTLVHE